MSTPALRIHFFGLLELVLDGESLPAPSSPKVRSLLAYLILHHDRPISRDRLTGLFWPERPDARARRALSQALWQIRSALGPAAARLMAERDAVAFLIHAKDLLDVEAFEEKVRALSDSLAGLGEAVTFYRADFFEECYDDWALLERERLREMYLGALERLITLLKQQDDYERALTCAQRLAAADPLRESAHRELMRLYHLLGRSQAALKQFATLRDLLEQELGVPPSPATAALYQEINAALEEAASPHLPVAAPPPPLLRDLAHLPFVGRTNERAALLYGLQTTVQGRGGMALVEGDAGVGKTRLISAILSDAEWRGFQVGLGKADPLAVSAPYQLLRDALAPLMTPLRITQLAGLVEPARLGAVTPLFPIIAEHLPDLPSLVPLDPLEEQGRLWDGLAQCIVGLASVAPFLLILEDLHWADETTLAALLHLTRCLLANRVFVILTYRTAEARERTAVWETLEALDRALPLLRLCLLPFERVEAVALVRRALGTGEADAQAVAFARRLQDETGGNALFLVETLKSLLEQGSLSQPSEGGWLFPARDLPLLTPASVQELIGGRLTRLSPRLQTVLEWVAVLGDDAGFSTLSEASDIDSTALLPALEELGWRGFLAEVEAEARYRFEHDRIQETVYQTIVPERRRQLHRRAGEVLKRLRSERVDLLAHHFSLGQVWDEAVDYNRQAGQQAQNVYAVTEAIGCYNRTIEAWAHLQPPDESLGLSLYEERGRICQDTGRLDQAEADFQTAYELAEQLGDQASQARILNHLSYLQWQQGDHTATVEIAQQALDLATAAGLRPAIATALFNKANATRDMGQPQSAIGIYQRAIALYKDLGDRVHLADALNRMGLALMYSGDFVKARSAIEQSLAIRRQLDHKMGIAYSLGNLGFLYYHLGHFDRCWEAHQETLELSRLIGDTWSEATDLVNMGWVPLEQGLPDQAIPLFQRALEISREIGAQAIEGEVLSGLGRAYHHIGDLEQAQEFLKQSLGMVPAMDQHFVPRNYVYLVEVCLETGRSDEAQAHARAGLRAAREIKAPWPLGVTHRAMGEVDARLGSDEAVTCFEESARILREVGAEAELARSLAGYGLYLNRSADAGKARHSVTLLDEARRLFQKLGMARDLAQLEAETGVRLRPGQIRVRLPHVDAPTGRPLRDDEFVEVAWIAAAPEDDEISGKATRRRQRLLRLLREAAGQSAAPTVAALAAALNASARTIKRDLAALRAEGHDVRTRGARDKIQPAASRRA